MIRCVYSEEPAFPATDQHPDAVRYVIGGFWVDAIGGEPSAEDVQAILRPSTSSAVANGVALKERQRNTAKGEAAALASAGDFSAAFSKLLEII